MSTFKVIMVKRGTWRGQNEEWSNGYHFSGDAPADRAAANAFFAALWTPEKQLVGAGQRLVQAYFYANPEGNATIGTDLRTDASATWDSAGGAYTTGTQLSLEQAAFINWRCGYTSKGKVRYVRKFYHGIKAKTSGVDSVAWEAGSYMAPILAKFTDGTLPGSAKLCRPDGTLCELGVLNPFVTTRTLKRRGKRPSS